VAAHRLLPDGAAVDDLAPRQGPIARSLADVRAVLGVAAPLATGPARPRFTAREALLYTVHSGGMWPGFSAEVAGPLRRAGLAVRESMLSPPAKARWIYNGVWCSHLEDLLAGEPDLTLLTGLGAVLSAVTLRGRLGDRRFHPTAAEILLQVAVGRLVFRDKRRALADAQAYRDDFERIWERGGVVVMPVCVWPAAKIGASNRNPRILECTMPGNLADATGLACRGAVFPTGCRAGSSSSDRRAARTSSSRWPSGWHLARRRRRPSFVPMAEPPENPLKKQHEETHRGVEEIDIESGRSLGSPVAEPPIVTPAPPRRTEDPA
jgi:hypothetical protein